MNIIYSASGVLTLLFIILLLNKKPKKLSDYLLAFWFMLILLVITATYISYNNIAIQPWLLELTDSSVYLYGPVIWFYTRALTEEDFRFRKWDVLHLLPFLLGTAGLIYPLMQGSTPSVAVRNVVLITKMGLLLVYGIAVLKHLRLHKRGIENYFSYTEKIKLEWLQLLVWSLLVIWVIGTVSQLLYAFTNLDLPQNGGYITNLAVSFFVLLIGYFGIRQDTVFVPYHMLEQENRFGYKKKWMVGKGQGTVSRSGTGQDPPEAPPLQKRYRRLLKFMDQERPYLDSQLTLHKLATQLEMPAHQLSRLINQVGGKNFFDFVNHYRVAEVKRQLQQGVQRRQTLLAIALDSGFNSKASFNRVFKKISGQTPREYLQSLEQ